MVRLGGKWVICGRLIIGLFVVLATTACLAEDLPSNPFGEPSRNSSDASGWAPRLTRSPEIIRGTGEVVGSPARPSTVPQGKGEITLNFENAAISDVVRAVLGDLLGLNYAIAPKIEGKVTIRTSRPLTRAAALPALEEVLALHGVAIVKVGNVYQVVPTAEAPRAATPPMVVDRLEMRSPGYGVEVVPLRFIAATQMEKVLNAVAPEASVLYVDMNRNLLLLGGTPEQLASLVDMVTIFDIDLMQGMSFALIPLEHSDANSVAIDLEKIFNINKDNPAGAVKILPITRLNSVLVISAELANIDHARNWVMTLDKGDQVSQRLYVYYLQNGRAKDVADVLGKLFGAQKGAEIGGGVAPGYTPTEISSAITSSPAISSSGLGSSPSAWRDTSSSSVPPISNTLASPKGPSGEVSTAPPAITSPTAGAPTTTEAAVVQFTAQAAVRIVAEPNINALVIYATASDYDTILQALRKIDIAPLQVMIEATIAEVTLAGDFQYGLQWFLKNIGMGADLNLDNTTSTDNTNNFKSPPPTAMATQAVMSAFSHTFTWTSMTTDFNVVLTAISHQTDVNIVSSPSLMVLDNQTARIQVGDQVPVLTGQAVSTVTAGAPVVNSVQYIDSGVILEIKPHVNNNGQVLLDITQQVSQPVTTTSSTIDSPTIQQRLITSSVAVQSGQTVALGGLIADRASKTGRGIPALRRMPVLGSLFGVKGRDSTRTELLVFLTPRVIRDWQDARDISSELSSRMRSLTPLGAKVQ
jgi:general secretion pathway protein D